MVLEGTKLWNSHAEYTESPEDEERGPLSPTQLCVQVDSKMNSSCQLLPSSSLELCWGYPAPPASWPYQYSLPSSTLSHIKNPTTLRFSVHQSRGRHMQVLISRPKICHCSASRVILIILEGSFTWLCWEVCRNFVLDLAFISLNVTSGVLLVMLFYDAEKTKGVPCMDDNSQTCPGLGSVNSRTWLH